MAKPIKVDLTKIQQGKAATKVIRTVKDFLVGIEKGVINNTDAVVFEKMIPEIQGRSGNLILGYNKLAERFYMNFDCGNGLIVVCPKDLREHYLKAPSETKDEGGKKYSQGVLKTWGQLTGQEIEVL